MADVTKLIETDHREVERLFAQFRQGRSKQTAMKICEELDAHASAEEYGGMKADKAKRLKESNVRTRA